MALTPLDTKKDEIPDWMQGAPPAPSKNYEVPDWMGGSKQVGGGTPNQIGGLIDARGMPVVRPNMQPDGSGVIGRPAIKRPPIVSTPQALPEWYVKAKEGEAQYRKAFDTGETGNTGSLAVPGNQLINTPLGQAEAMREYDERMAPEVSGALATLKSPVMTVPRMAARLVGGGANAFTGGLIGEVFPKSFGSFQGATQGPESGVLDPAASLAGTIAAFSLAETGLPEIAGAAKIGQGALIGAGLTLPATSLRVATGEETPLAGIADVALNAATVAGFAGAGAAQNIARRLISNIAVSAGSEVAGKAIHGESVTPGDIIGATVTGAAFGLAGPHASIRAMPEFKALTRAIGEQESSSGANQNPSSKGALGYYQIMQNNIPQWSRDVLGSKVKGQTDEQLIDAYSARDKDGNYTPEAVALQKEIGEGKQAQFYKQALKITKGDPHEAAELVARKWVGGNFKANNKEADTYVSQVFDKYQKNLPKEANNATQEGNEPKNNIEQHQGIPRGENIPENVSEVRQGEGGQASNSGGAVGKTEEQEKQITSIPGEVENVQSELSGGGTSVSAPAQSEGVSEGIRANGENRENNAEGPPARGGDFESDIRDKSIREGKENGVEEPQGGRTYNDLTAKPDLWDPEISDTWEEAHRLLGEDKVRPEAKLLSDEDIVGSLAPINTREATLQYLAQGGKLSKEDATRDVFGTNLSPQERSRNYLHPEGMSIDQFVHEWLPDTLGQEQDHWRDSNELDARNEVHDVIQSIQSSKHAREQLAKGYRDQLAMEQVPTGEHLFASPEDEPVGHVDEGDMSFDFGANRTIGGETIPPAEQGTPLHERFADRYIGIADRLTNKEREENGLAPRNPAEPYTDEQAWNDVKEYVSKEGNERAGSELVDSLIDNPKQAPSKFQNALLLHERGIRGRAVDKAVERVNRLIDSEAPEKEIRSAQTLRDEAQGAYDKTIDAAKSGEGTGITEAARALQSRAMLVDPSDMSVASLTSHLKSAGTKPLAPEEHEFITKVSKGYAEADRELTDFQKQREAEKEILSNQSFDELLNKRMKEWQEDVEAVKRQSGARSTKLRSLADKLEARADEEIRSLGGSLRAEILPGSALFSAYAKKLSAYALRGIDDAIELGKIAVEKFGEHVRPVLQQLIESAKEKASIGQKAVFADEVKSLRNNNDLSSGNISKIMRTLFNAGIPKEELLSAATVELKKSHPNLTEEKVRDAFTQYGKATFPSKLADRTAVRELRQSLLWTTKLEKLEKGQVPLRTGPQRGGETSEIRDLRKKVNDLLAKNGLEKIDPERSLRTQADVVKARMKSQIEDVQKRIVENNYERPEKTEREKDDEEQNLRLERDRWQREFQDAKAKKKLANRPKFVKILDGFSDLRRAGALSSPSAYGKILGYAILKAYALTPLEAIGSARALQLLNPGLAERTSRYGQPISFRDLKDSYFREMNTKGLNDFWKNAKFQVSDLELMDKERHPPGEITGIIAKPHQAGKAMLKRGEYELSKMLRTRQYEMDGKDISQPYIKDEIHQKAMDDAKEAILLQHNFVSDAQTGLLTMLEHWKKYPKIGKLTATAIRVVAPLVRVGTNVVKQGAQYSVGLPVGLIRSAAAKFSEEGYAGLSEDEAAEISRWITRGTLGAVMGAGIYASGNYGGFYHKGENRQPGELGPEDVELFGHRLAPWQVVIFNHTPMGIMAQTMATMRNVREEALESGNSDAFHSVLMPVIDGTMGAVSKVPLMEALSTGANIFSGGEGLMKYAGTLAKDMIEPQGIQFFAKMFDSNEGKPVKRSPENVIDELKMGIPGLRNQVPEKKSNSVDALREHVAGLMQSGRKLQAENEIDRAVSAGTISPNLGKRMKQSADLTKMQRKVNFGKIEEALDLYGRLDPDRRREIRGVISDRLLKTKQGARTNATWTALRHQATQFGFSLGE